MLICALLILEIYQSVLFYPKWLALHKTLSFIYKAAKYLLPCILYQPCAFFDLRGQIRSPNFTEENDGGGGG